MTGATVSGVSGVCQVGSCNLTQLEAAWLLTCGVGVSGVSGLTRVRACVCAFFNGLFGCV
ncbi:hypothetical protein D3C80_1503810 [compost metagenome]